MKGHASVIYQTADLASPAILVRGSAIFGWVPLLLTLSLSAAAASDLPAASQPQGATLSSGRSVIASGGGTSTGGNFAINGTIGQTDADPLQPSTGGTFAIIGGFWFTAVPPPDGLLGDGFESP
jgi:hypothetical protein